MARFVFLGYKIRFSETPVIYATFCCIMFLYFTSIPYSIGNVANRAIGIAAGFFSYAFIKCLTDSPLAIEKNDQIIFKDEIDED